MVLVLRTLLGHVTHTYVSWFLRSIARLILHLRQPTLSEAFKEAAMAAYDKAIHF